ncbi:Plasmodium exported protein (hyp5), unknown, putative [Plasmodium gaboni]|uniref:Exported protein (Hyp15) n=1 Tax=Plasmodium gaboni TaxID=647221 RepID=A0ABY0KWB8_9APIC|nr:Plasmodium exported protein (hyp5), unknown, putative [Plasmodium gaboni]
MLFLSLKLFIFIIVLNIILVFNKNNNVINIFENNFNSNKELHIRINKSLAEYIKDENKKYESNEFDLLYEELVKEKLKNYKRLMDLRKKDKNYERKRRRDKKWQDKVVKRKMKQYYILRDILNYENNKYARRKTSTISNNDSKNMKDKLYEIIFKGTSFWKRLGSFLKLIGIWAAQYNIFVIISSLVYLLAYVAPDSFLSTFLIVFSGIYGVFILLIIITVIVVVSLVVWLWPKDDKNIINKTLEHN